MEELYDFGQMGENELDIWANRSKITHNRSLQQDKKGWDHCLQFKSKLEDLFIPLDRQMLDFTCWFQVKSTSTNQKRFRVKLSNWVHLVKQQYPAFYIVYYYSTEADLIKAYLVHVWEHWCFKVLKKLRELNKNKEVLLNKE